MPPEDEVNLRESLSDAFEAHESEEVASEDLDPGEPEKVEKEPEKVEKEPEEVKEAKTDIEIPSFVPKEGPKAFSAPKAWKPGPREHWDKLPGDVKSEIGRREREISIGMRESAESRRVASEFTTAIQPYMHFIEAEQSTPVQAVKNMMQTAAIFRTGTAQQKAQTAAHIIKNFGVDIPMLDSMLAGNHQSDPVQRQIQEGLAPVHALQQQIRQMQQQRAQEIDSSAAQTISQFGADPKNEFFDDVRETMADILDLATQRGQSMGLQTAYDRAIMMHDDISQIVTQRKITEQAGKRSGPARQARARAVSVTGAPSLGDPSPKSESMRDDILNAIDSQIAD